MEKNNNINQDLEIVKSNFDPEIIQQVANFDGVWKHYKRNNIEDANEMYNSVKDKDTKWFISESLENSCYSLEDGENYIYYTKDENGEYTIPKVLFGFMASTLFEIRGINEYEAVEKEFLLPALKKIHELEDMNNKSYHNTFKTMMDYFELATIKNNYDKELPANIISKLRNKKYMGYEYFYVSDKYHFSRMRKDDMFYIYDELLNLIDSEKILPTSSESISNKPYVLNMKRMQ